MFNWIRVKVREAFLNGINDAVTLLTNEPAVAPAELPPDLAERFMPRLPASEEPASVEKVKRKRVE